MRIVVDLQCCQNGSRFRGIGRYALAITKAMIASGRGHEFRLFLTDAYPETIAEIRREFKGILPQEAIAVCSLIERTTAADADNAWRNRAAELIRREYIARLEPDLLFVPALFEGMWDNAVISVEKAPFPTAVTLHDLIPLEDQDLYIPKQQDREGYSRKLRDARRADLLICISAFVAEEAAKVIGADPARIMTVLNGVDDRFRPPAPGTVDRADLMARMGITRPFIFNTSPFEHRKNLHGLIAGLGCMSREVREGHQLVIAGGFDSHARKRLAELVRGEGLPADTLVLPGRISDEDLVALYSECALFAFPALSEGFGLPPLEAMACGAPVLVSTTTSLPEVVDRADLLVDPMDPRAIGAAIERILTDAELQSELRVYGPKRASTFSWKKAAQTVLDAFERLHRERRQAQVAPPAAATRPRLAIVCPTIDWHDHHAGRLAGLVAQLSESCRVTLICPETDAPDGWARAHAEVRAFDWLEWNAAQFDLFVYVADRVSGGAFAELIERFPGILLLLDGLDPLSVAKPVGREMDIAVQRGLYAAGGPGALIDAAKGSLDEDQALAAIGEDLIRAARLVLREGEGLPLLPLARSGQAGTALRDEFGISRDVSLVVAIAASEEAGAELMRQFRAADGGSDAHLLCHVMEEAGTDDESDQPLHLPGGVHRVWGPISGHYRGLLSAADLLLVSADIPAGLRKRLEEDAEAMELAAIADADRTADLPDRIASLLPGPARSAARPKPVAVQLGDSRLSAWADRIIVTAGDIAARPPSILTATEAALPGSVRGRRPDGNDLARVAVALATNSAIEREPLCFLDLTAYAMPGRGRRVDPVVRSQLLALLRRGGASLRAVVRDGDRLRVANQFVGDLLGLRSFFLGDEPLVARPGDRIIGLDLFHAFAPESAAALRAAHDRGAALLYVAAGEMPLQGNRQDDLAELIFAWSAATKASARRTIASPYGAKTNGQTDPRLTALMREAAAADMPLAILSFEGGPAATGEAAIGHDFEWVEAPDELAGIWADRGVQAEQPASVTRQDELSFGVMGHLVGSYSLAIINRSVARTLEEWRPGKVRFLAYETNPITYTDGVPASEKPLMAELCARPEPASGEEIMISQHWPILTPRGRYRLTLSLFPWEESCIPRSIIETLEAGFDGIIAPSQAVTNALTLSGITVPVATIGQPVDLTPFAALAAAREPRRPIRRFLHVSSCFERKGIDLLLAAWAKAFTDSDNVSLLIKTFPNPHNQVEALVAEVRSRHPRLAPIEIVNRDVERKEMPNYYAEADVLVLPTRGEGYNLPALEAMAAGLPLIVTGHGGHRDFCGPDQARLISYRFARSGSHVAGDHALWAEPDLDDLVQALRDYANPAHAKLIEARRQSALAAAALEGDRTAWTRRFQGVVDDLMAQPDLSTPRVGWISSWGVTCGIAQYSAHLIDRMSPALHARLTILCDRRTPADSAGLEVDPSWTVMEGDAEHIGAGLRRHDLEALVIQHQDGLVPWEQLGRIGHDPAIADIVSVVILHNVRTLSWKVNAQDLQMVLGGLGNMTRLLVHTLEDLNILRELGLDRNAGLFPHGAVAPLHSPWPRTIRPDDAPVIGCHGFFLRHKGIDKLIRAAAILRRQWPNLRLRLINARFPNPEHEDAPEECRALARELGLEDAIEWHLDFLPVERIEELLSGCDMIVLPYDESDDSVSGAVRTALASMVPLVATRVKIFGDLGAAVGWADSNDPQVLADTIAPLLRSPEKRREIQAGMYAWLQAHDWQRMANMLENMIHGLVRQKRLGWLARRN